MIKIPRFSLILVFSLLSYAQNSSCFSFKSMRRVFASAVFTRFVRVFCKSFVLNYVSGYLESHGYDLGSQKKESRRSGACSISFPTCIQSEVPIADATVPQLVRQRVQVLKNGRYHWPACKPLLLTGLPGTGKTQLARYIAKESNCPFMYASAAGFMSAKGNSGVETVIKLFKFSRIRSQLSTWILCFRQLFALLTWRRIPRKKPAIVLIDEFDAISKPAGLDVLEGDRDLEEERDRTFARLQWEISNNEYVQNQLQAPRCPPAELDEQLCCLGTLWSNKIRELQGMAVDKHQADRYLADFKGRWPCYWRWLMGRNRTETVVVATTNHRVDELEPDVRNWFDVIDIQPFNIEQRRAILELHGRNKKFQGPEIIDHLAEHSEGYSADKLASILNDAALLAAERDGIISQDDIDNSMAELV